MTIIRDSQGYTVRVDSTWDSIVVGTARGRVRVDSTWDSIVVGTARGRVRVDSTWDSSRDSQG